MLKFPLPSAALVCAALSLSFGPGARAAEIGANKSSGVGLNKEDRQPVPQVAPASPEAENNLKRIKVPAGLRLDLWAAEPMMANPVAFSIDEKGRIFVSETYRYRTSVLDIRHYMYMLEDDLACRTVDDRIAMCQKWFGKQAEDLKIETEVVRLLEDTTGSGVANKSSVYAENFNTMLDGIASGVLARKDKVYFTDIPNLWLLQGTDKDGHAKKRESLSFGYGVRFSFTGHDMHGLTIGPDGKLYYSIGDRAANVKTKEGKVISYPDEGMVFRCNLDGSDLEVVYHGLRNPQELTFDQYGNLFTGDNDFDHGDEERLVYLVEGGDSGWRVGYQHPPLGYDHVPWKSEHIWLSHNFRQADYYGKELKNRIPDTGIRPAAYLPPISNIGDGPSGFTYNPGSVALPAKYDNHFFLCHFKGAIGTSQIQTFTVKTKGAGFELTGSEPFITQLQPTDCDFGPDGALYFTDWGEGWERTKKGRIYRVYDPALINDAAVLATKQLIGEGMDKRSTKDLMKLLEHRDRRVRQEAEFALAERKAVKELAQVAAKDSNQLARLHAIWGLGIVARKDARALASVVGLLADADAEVRAQAAKVLGDGKVTQAYPALVKNLADSSLRVRMFSAIALGKLGNPAAFSAVVEMLRANDNQDAFVRHGGVMALAGIANEQTVASLSKDKSPAVRLAAVLVLRRFQSAEIARFLNDAEQAVVIEAARAINDAPIVAAQAQLAALATENAPTASGKWSEAFLLRVINANYRIGAPLDAQQLAKFVAAKTAPVDLQVEAVHALGTWAQPPQRDRVLGIYRPLADRSPAPAAEALQPVIGDLLQNAATPVREAAAVAAGQLAMKDAVPVLFQLIGDQNVPSSVRVAALDAIAAMKDAKLAEAINVAVASTDVPLRMDANRLLGVQGGGEAVKQLGAALANGGISEKQSALSALAGLDDPEATKLISRWMDDLIAGKVPDELKLDVLEAAGKSHAQQVIKKVAKYEGMRTAGDDLAAYRETMAGGNAAAGKKIFLERADAQCIRCHRYAGEGSDVGPDLSAIGGRQNREYILESIVYPNKKIAPGFESVTIETKDGEEVSGVFKGETATEILIAQPGVNGPVKVKKSDVKSRRTGLSGMPEGFGQLLSKQDIRNLVEFLSTSK